MDDMIYEANTLRSLLADQEAAKAARKKLKYVEAAGVDSRR
jgi:hypothetical protein